jgi:pantothenate kinase-related protein Tda10
MGMYIDFCVKYDPQVDTKEDVTKRIFYAMYIKRMKGKKPATTGMFGDSGEGKSETAIAICDMLLQMQGIDIVEVFNDVEVFGFLKGVAEIYI